MTSQHFDAVDGRLFLEIRANVESIEVVAKSIHAKVSVIDPIYIDYGDYHKYKHVSQQMSP